MAGPVVLQPGGHAGWPDPGAAWEGGGSHPDWTRDVDSPKWKRRDTSGYIDWYKVPNCPRCGHPMSVVVAPGAYRDATAPAGDPDTVAAICNCDAKHDGRPEKRRGCGYSGWIARPSSENTE